MNKKEILFSAFFVASCLLVNAFDPAVIVHSTFDEIDACKGKLKLKLIRIWGGDREKDENKFFRKPDSIVVNKKGNVYISDMNSHCIKVFDSNGRFMHTIGRRGRGPGDIYTPGSIALFPGGDLLVFEIGGRRLQRFSPEGKSKLIINSPELLTVIGATSKNEMVVYSPYKAFISGKLITFLNEKGRTIKEMGLYHDKSKDYVKSEKLIFTLDSNDQIYAAHTLAPVIRVYSPNGNMLKVITFEIPFNVPYKITLNTKGDEINKVETDENYSSVRVKGTDGGGVTVQEVQKKGKPKVRVCAGIGTDSKRRLYVVTKKRLQTEKEQMGSRLIMDSNGIDRRMVDFNVVEKSDIFRLMVFKPDGKVIAEAQLATMCDGIYLYGNRIYILDGSYNQRILEYQLQFED
jgi:sugar lactone lactonase YvrE